MKKLFLTALLLSVSGPAGAHPGHGAVMQDGHVHGIGEIGLLAMVLIVGLALYRSRSGSK